MFLVSANLWQKCHRNSFETVNKADVKLSKMKKTATVTPKNSEPL